jgi:hypothetical protein|nr:MAG TPA: YopX protein [Caudoviricetes sp.]
MNRKILFRGKKSNGRWVYGSLVVSENVKPAIYYEEGKGLAKRLDWCYVKPDTIGQYTGLKDKAGNKIFEGDILTGQNCRFVVKYDERQAEFVAVNSTLPKGFGLPMSQTWIDETKKVIGGNIHDNPELMK